MDLERYIEEVTGTRPVVQSMPPSETAALPLYLRAAYLFGATTLLGRRVVLATEQEAPNLKCPSFR